MMYKNLFVTGSLSTLLLASSLFAQDCPNCKVNLENLKYTKTKEFQKKSIKFMPLKSEHNAHSVVSVSDSYELVVDGKVTLIFPSYVMSEEEKENYYREQRAIALNKKANEEANRELKLVVQPEEKIENKILNKKLPKSEYFCDNDKKPVRVKNSNRYECVS